MVAIPPPVLDACCGSRSFWFQHDDQRALFIDNRNARYRVDVGTPGTRGRSDVVINPDIVADFTAMYGVLQGDWRDMLRRGFAECFRVLKPNGVLVFKWAESQFKVREIVELAPVRPLFGHQTSKTTHWSVFIKPEGAP